MVSSTAKDHSLTPAVFTKKPPSHYYCLLHVYRHSKVNAKQASGVFNPQKHSWIFFSSSLLPYPLLLGICSQVGGLWSYFWLAQPTFEMTFTFLLSFRAKNNPPWHNLWSIFGRFRRLKMNGCWGFPHFRQESQDWAPSVTCVHQFLRALRFYWLPFCPWSYLACLSIMAFQKANRVVQLKLT